MTLHTQGSDSDGEGEDDEEDDDNASFASVDDLEGMIIWSLPKELKLMIGLDNEGATHMQELSKLAEKDPEFYKYLQENDSELLNFDTAAMDDGSDEEGEDADMDENKAPVLTAKILKEWQKSLLEVCGTHTSAQAHINEPGLVPVTSCPTKASRSLSFCCAYE